MASVEECVCIKDFEVCAEKNIPSNVMTFVNSGSMNEQTLEENCNAFKKWRFQPRCLVDVKTASLQCTVLGETLNFPIGISPTGQMKLLSSCGEVGLAEAAKELGTVFIESTHASVGIDDVMAASRGGHNWLQSYILDNRDKSRSLIERAEAIGYKAIVMTVDSSALGRRYRLLKAKPFTVSNANVKEDVTDWGSIAKVIKGFPAVWEDIRWLKSFTSLPIILKGIMTPQDALAAIDHGASAIWVSNHGGRQFDGVLPTIYALPAIAKAVKRRCPIFLDGGIRNGADAAKALALGADCVFVGRPTVWGLASGGAAGAKKVLETLRDELELSMKLLGVASIEELRSDSNLVVHESKFAMQV